MTPFKPGDRVRVFTQSEIRDGVVIEEPGSVTEWMTVKTDTNGSIWRAHPRQCRRLVKRKRREIWVNEYTDGLTGSYYYQTKAGAEHGNTTGDGYRRTIRFVEAKESE